MHVKPPQKDQFLEKTNQEISEFETETCQRVLEKQSEIKSSKQLKRPSVMRHAHVSESFHFISRFRIVSLQVRDLVLCSALIFCGTHCVGNLIGDGLETQCMGQSRSTKTCELPLRPRL